jgi:hypothetical protein
MADELTRRDPIDRLADVLEGLVRHQSIGWALQRIERKLDTIILMEENLMALGQDILDSVTAETTAVDSFIALVQGLIANNTVSAQQGAAIIAAVNSNKSKLDAAILANTVPPTP